MSSWQESPSSVLDTWKDRLQGALGRAAWLLYPAIPVPWKGLCATLTCHPSPLGRAPNRFGSSALNGCSWELGCTPADEKREANGSVMVQGTWSFGSAFVLVYLGSRRVGFRSLAADGKSLSGSSSAASTHYFVGWYDFHTPVLKAQTKQPSLDSFSAHGRGKHPSVDPARLA